MQLIAIANQRGGFLDFFRIERYKGQPLEYGDYVFNYTNKPQEIERLRFILKEIKKAYKYDMDLIAKNKRVIAYQRSRAEIIERREQEKIIRGLKNDKTIGF